MAGAPEDLSPARVAELLRDGAQVIDVRETYEREAGRIPDDSAHIELDRLTAEADSIDRERAELEAFADAVAAGQPFLVPPQDMVNGIAVLESIEKSSARGRPITIDP